MMQYLQSVISRPRHQLGLLLRLCLFCMIATILPAGQHANAKAVIVAIVNGDPITNLEVEDRMNFIRLATNITITTENMRSLRDDALQALIEDRLKLQEANNVVPGAEIQAQNVAASFIEQNFGRDGMTAQEILSQENVNIETVLAKYTADVLWSNTLRIRFARQFASLDKNAEKEQQKIKQSFSEPQIKLSEIILLATPQRNLEQTQAMAQEIVKAARQGASFSGIAQQYSAAGSASRGGDVGWLFIERLPDAFKAPLMAAKDGDILEPVTQSGQVYIFKREELREQGLLDPKATIVTLARAVDELAEDVSNDQIQSRSKALTEKTASLNSCNQIEALNAELGSDVQSVIRDLALSDLSPQLQRQIISLEVNEPSQPLKFAEGLVVFMVCERKLPELDLPSLESLKQRELERIMTSLSGRFLLRLQRNARIELK